MNTGLLSSEYAAPPMPFGLGPAAPLPMPGRFHHREAIDWQRRVIDNGGSVSAFTLAAVSEFCHAMDRSGVRSRLFRLNLFCGNSISAALVPLYRGPSFFVRQLGNTTDTNANFVSGDYIETGTSGGLAGNGSTKRLQTGMDAVTAGLLHTDTHISWHSRAQITGNNSVVSTYGGGGAQASFGALTFGGIGQMYYRSGGANNCGIEGAAWTAANRAGHLIVQRTGSDARCYRNGTDLNMAVTMTNTNNWSVTSPGAPSVFARNRADTGNTADQFLTCTLQGYSIGASLTNAQAAAFSAAMLAFQTSLGRN